MAMLHYDFYSPLLTDKQKKAYELYFRDDLSLTEVAKELGVSRQAAFDLIKRAKNRLEDTEKKLGLVKRWRKQMEEKQKLLSQLESVLNEIDENSAKKLKSILSQFTESGSEL